MIGMGVNPPVRSVDEILSEARGRLSRVTPEEAYARQRAGALLVDIRYEALRRQDGTVPGALIVERNELEWRLDPACAHRADEATGHDLRVVVICDEGYASSLAAVSLHRLGLRHATDVSGGFRVWRAAGLPVQPPAPRPSGDGTPPEASTTTKWLVPSDS